MPTYPFDGCCAHGGNTHTRDRCLACGCTKPAVQVTTPQTAKVVPQAKPEDEIDLLDLHRCGLCKALHLITDREAHLDWHEKIIGQIHAALVGVSALRHKGAVDNADE